MKGELDESKKSLLTDQIVFIFLISISIAGFWRLETIFQEGDKNKIGESLLILLWVIVFGIILLVGNIGLNLYRSITKIRIYSDPHNPSNLSKMSVWAYSIIPLDGILIYILSTYGGLLLLFGLMEGIILLSLDLIIFYFMIQVMRGSKSALEINFVLVMVIFSLIFVFMINFGGPPGIAS